MWFCFAADGGFLDDGGDSAVHDCHAARHPFSYVRYHDVIRSEFIRLLAG